MDIRDVSFHFIYNARKSRKNKEEEDEVRGKGGGKERRRRKQDEKQKKKGRRGRDEGKEGQRKLLIIREQLSILSELLEYIPSIPMEFSAVTYSHTI